MHQDWLKKAKETPKCEENLKWLSDHCSMCCSPYLDENPNFAYECPKGCEEDHYHVCILLDKYMKTLDIETF